MNFIEIQSVQPSHLPLKLINKYYCRISVTNYVVWIGTYRLYDFPLQKLLKFSSKIAINSDISVCHWKVFGFYYTIAPFYWHFDFISIFYLVINYLCAKEVNIILLYWMYISFTALKMVVYTHHSRLWFLTLFSYISLNLFVKY